MTGVMTTARLMLPARPSSVPLVRDHVRRLLAEWRRPELIDTAALVVTELAANAVRVSGDADAGILVDLRQDGETVLIEVWDRARTVPAMKDPALDEEGGRGLRLVNALARSWGFRLLPTGGKVVWVALRAS